MGVRVRPINENDKVKLIGQVDKITSAAIEREIISTTESRSIFHNSIEQANKGWLEEQGLYNRRGYISLVMPVMNYFLAGKELSLISKILDRSREDIQDIAKGEIIYDRNLKQEIRLMEHNNPMLHEAYDRERFLIGAEYIRELIDKLDIEYEILNFLTVEVKSVFKDVYKNGLSKEKIIKTDNPNKDYLWLIDRYYLLPSEILKLQDFERVWRAKRVEIGSSSSRLILLLSLIYNSKSVILDQIMNFIVVMPIGYRPRIESRKTDLLTDAYNQIILRNIDLQGILMYTNSKVSELVQAYKNLVIAVQHLMISNELRKTDQAYKPIAETLKGKKGLIRNRMEGVRIDYSGRSVIIVDPEMSVDTIGIPKSMAVKLMELLIVKAGGKTLAERLNILLKNNQRWKEKEAIKLLEGEYTITGRQPTLFYLGIKAFRTKVVDGNAIVLNPLCTTSFNADFDGDQMHVEIPITPESKLEIEQLMASTKNLYLSRNGECHIAPRQEILHGLWKACTVELATNSRVYTLHKNNVDYKFVYDGVCIQKINIYDRIIMDDEEIVAGKAALRYALGWDTYGTYSLGVFPLVKGHKRDKPVTEKWFKKLLGHIALEDISVFVTTVNRLVKLGFAIANIFPPNMSVLEYPDISYLIKEFDENVKQREEYYNMGFETEESFTAFYNKEYIELEKKVKSELEKRLSTSCGYMDMYKSGARGSLSNVMQLFGMKGRVMKNENEAFNVILKHPLAAELTGLEHAITAYGSRQGLVDKTVATYEPGYLYRQLSHTTAELSIMVQDCKTENGLLIDYDLIKQFMSSQSLTGVAEGDNNKIKSYITQVLVGRYIVGRDDMIKNIKQAEEIYDEGVAKVKNNQLIKLRGIKLRSPITCANPCCVKCYGIDLTSNKQSVVGLPIGYIAAQSIGEPGTQLTMKNFQSGGVAGISNLTSSFDIMDNYMHLIDLRGSNASKPLAYDFISPYEGYVRTISKGDGTKVLRIEQTDKEGRIKNSLRSKVLLYEDVELKDYVKKGETIQKIQGDLNMKEVIKYRGVDFAQRYLVFKLYDIFHSNVDVNLKHFEVLVLGMTLYLCLKGNEHFRVGCEYTSQQYYNNSKDNCYFEKMLYGVKDIPLKKTDVFSTMFMERIVEGLSKSIITSGYDSLTNPIVRTAFGLSLNMGSDIEGYIDTKGMKKVEGYDM